MINPDYFLLLEILNNATRRDDDSISFWGTRAIENLVVGDQLITYDIPTLVGFLAKAHNATNCRVLEIEHI